MEITDNLIVPNHKYNTRYKNNLKLLIESKQFSKIPDYDLDILLQNLNKKYIIKYYKFKSAISKKPKKKNISKNIVINKNNINKYTKNGNSNNTIIYYLDETEEESDDDEEESEDEDYEEESEEQSEEESEEESKHESEEESEEDDDEENEEQQGNESKQKFKELANKILLKNKQNFIDKLVEIANKSRDNEDIEDTENAEITENEENSEIIENSQDYKSNKRLELKLKNKNIKEFKKLTEDNFEYHDDSKYFKEQLSIEEQKNIITQLKNINKLTKIEKPYKILLLEKNIPDGFKAVALKKINIMENLDPSVSEYYKLKNWIDNFMLIPFENTSKIPVSINDGTEICNEFMENSLKILDEAVYGLNDAKMQIMQYLGQLIVNPESIGTAIAIKGPMGTGKTSLVKNGISKILNRPFALIPLGGATDSPFLEGHSYTYEGSTWGKIVDILIQTKSSNPIIYFDELDKVSDTPKGEEIIGILTHLIDSTQNSNFHDKYFSEIDFNLSKALFIFSYNDESKVNTILRDRMYKISTKGYNLKEKKTIANNYLIPFICKELKFSDSDIIIPEESLNLLIEKYTENESGVRNLKRCLETIFKKINLFRLLKPNSSVLKEEKSIEIKLPFTVSTTILEKIIKLTKNENENDNWKKMYM